MTPTKNKIFVRQDKSDQTSGGLIIADTVKQTNRTGTVEAIGADVDEVSVGDRIIYERATPHPALKDLLIVDIENVAGIIPPVKTK